MIDCTKIWYLANALAHIIDPWEAKIAQLGPKDVLGLSSHLSQPDAFKSMLCQFSSLQYFIYYCTMSMHIHACHQF